MSIWYVWYPSLTYSEDMAHEGNKESITCAWMVTLLASFLVNHVCTCGLLTDLPVVAAGVLWTVPVLQEIDLQLQRMDSI